MKFKDIINKINLQFFATTTDLQAAKAEVYAKELMERFVPKLQWYKYAKKVPMPKNGGDTISIRTYNPITPKKTELTEGVAPTPSTFTNSKKSMKLKQYGDYVPITDLVDETLIDDVALELTGALGESGGIAIDELVRDTALAGTNVFRAGGVATIAAITANITYLDILKVAKTMKQNLVPKAKTEHGEGYVMFVSPSVAMDILLLPEYQAFNQYDKSDKLLDGCIGKLGGIYFIEIDNAGTVADGARTIHQSYCFGKDPYAVAEIDNHKTTGKPRIIRKGFNEGGATNPLEQIATIGWKALFANMRLNELSGLRYESLATV